MNKGSITRTATLLFYLTICTPVFAEDPAKTLSNYLKNTHFKGEMCWLKPEEKLIPFNQGLNCYIAKHNYLWYNNRLTIQLDGSGRLFQYIDNDSLARIDHTCYEGYNFDAFTFVHHDTLFSLGGYGYWQFNTQLRYFDEKVGEWSIIPTNKSIPIRVKLFSQAYLNKEKNKLYVTYFDPGINPTLNTMTDRSKLYVQCLDLNTKKWWEHERSFLFRQDRNDNLLLTRNNSIQLPQGLLFTLQNESLLLDFEKNRTYRLPNNTHQSILSLIGTLIPWMGIPEKEGIAFFNSQNGNVVKIRLAEESFVPLPDKIYAADEPAGSPFAASSNWLTTTALSATILFLLYHIRTLRTQLREGSKIKNPAPTEEATNAQVPEITKPIFRDNLTEVENALVSLLIQHSENNQKTTPAQINHAIGLSKKETRLQNNIRAATLLMVNKKFRVFSGIAEDLIQKERTEFDKRFFEYYIPKKYLSKIK